MKFIEFPPASFSVPAGGWGSGIVYKNNTNNYVMVMGLGYYSNRASNNVSTPFLQITSVNILDANGNSIDTIFYDEIDIDSETATIPVYNGTSVVNESASIPVAYKTFMQRARGALIPPQGVLNMAAYSPSATQVTVETSGWGFSIDEDELIAIIIKKMII